MKKGSKEQPGQLRIESYMLGRTVRNKATKKERERDRHASSREGSEYDQHYAEAPVKLEVYSYKSKVFPPTFLIGPSDTIYFDSINKKLSRLLQDYSKEAVLKLVADNLKYHNIDNISKLQSHIDDDFWSSTLPQLLNILVNQIRDISCCIRLLHTEKSQVIEVTRLQGLIILSCMFFGILPRQVYEEHPHFGQLMTVREIDSVHKERANARFNKLLSLINYFKMIIQSRHTYNQHIQFQRTFNYDHHYLEVESDRYTQLKSITILPLESTSIEDYYCEALMVDFANKRIGGGVLRNGCVQEEILFTIFPQLIIARIICAQIDDREAIIITGARRYSKYKGYSDTFQFAGPYTVSNKKKSPQSDSIFIAIDAIDFSKSTTTLEQYTKKSIRREIHKAATGFKGVDSHDSMHIATGKWGCGAFKGDQQLKFLIQWVAASQAGRDLIYLTDMADNGKPLQFLYDSLKDKSSTDLISIMDEYYKFRVKQQSCTLINYIKAYVI